MAGQSHETGTIFFLSSCDPLGQNPHGRQVFAMQPDGSDLRQLTSASGFVANPDGSIEVETVSRMFIAPKSGQ